MNSTSVDQTSEASGRPTVFLLPDLMGSRLHSAGTLVWIHELELKAGGFASLTIDAPNVQATGLAGVGYNRLAAFLTQSHEVVPFPYDWRRSIAHSADLLAEKTAACLEVTEQPVRFLSHGMGGLVVRSMVARHPDVWKQVIARAGSRLVMLGTPVGGMWSVVRLLVGDEPVIKHLAQLDAVHSKPDLLKIFARFPGLLELLPRQDGEDFFLAAAWEGVKAAARDAGVPSQPALAAAVATIAQIDSAGIAPEHLQYVAGTARATASGLEIRERPSAAAYVQFFASARGDGRVLWDTAQLPDVRTWFMAASHGSMCDDRRVYPALVELLEQGRTSKLPMTPRRDAAVSNRRFLFPAEPEVPNPQASDVERAALGSSNAAKLENDVEPLKVCVVHGNLSFSTHPVAVGHYDGDALVAAEQVLDQCLGGKLKDKLLQNRYPGPINSSLVILQEKGHPPGAIVVGLGSAGGLTPDGLAQSFEHAVLAYAGEIAAHAGDPADAANVTSASITTLLIGSGKGGMSVPDSVRALLKGALRARASLANATAGPRVQLDSLEFCELYYDTCVAAHRALCDAIERRRFAGKIDLVKHVTSRRGGRQRVAFENASETWETLSISAQQDGSLRFQTSDGRARVLVTLLTLLPEQKERLDSYVRQATNTVSGDATVAEELYRQLLPVELKRYTPGRERLLLTVDETAAAYPWELLRDDKSPGTEPLAARQPLIRKLATHAFRTDPVHATQEDILVIGNPMTPLPPLAGAVSEARWIERQFTAGRWSVTALIGTPSAPILKALGAKPYRILHVAAHGVFEHEKESGKVTGVVLGDGVYLVPMQLDSMPYVPELAFLNCCHLGRITATQAAETAGAAPDAAASAIARPQLAANLATQLIQMGARAVVAAGWKVEDRAAVTFASTFYQEMLAGRPFGEAVHAARYETYVRHPNVNTWGAYQCYGNPDYVLSRGEAYAAPAPESFSSVQELVTGISNLCHDADTMSQLGRKELQRRLRFMLGSIQRDEWLLEPEVLGVLARAYAQLGMFDEAVDLYAQLYRTGVSSFGACEQLANLRVRSAVTRWKRDGAPVGSPDHAKLINTILRAVRDLKRLPYTPPMPSERRALIASAYKRLSQISQGRDRISALTKTAAAYRRAHKTARKRLGRVDTYPLHNWLAARIVLYKLGHGKELEDLTALLDEGEKATVQDEQENVTFWSGVARGDALLIKHYGLGDLAAHVEEIIDAYHRPWSRGGSAKDLGSVIENIAWLIDVSASQSSDRATARSNNAEEEAVALSAIQQAVTAFLSEGFDPAAQETLRADNAALDGAF